MLLLLKFIFFKLCKTCSVTRYFTDLGVSGSTVSSNLGTVVNVGNYTQLSESTITYTATMRVGDVVQNTNGRRLAIVSDTIVDGRPQVPSSLTLKVCTCPL